MGGLVFSPAFDFSQGHKEIGSSELADRLGRQVGKNQRLERPLGFLEGAGFQLFLLQGQPFAGNRLEGVRRRELLGLSFIRGIDVVGDLAPGFVPSGTGLLQRNFRVRSQRQKFFLAAESVLEAPPARSAGIQQQIEAIAVKQLLGPLGRLGCSYRSVAEPHGGIPRLGGNSLTGFGVTPICYPWEQPTVNRPPRTQADEYIEKPRESQWFCGRRRMPVDVCGRWNGAG